MLQIKRAYDLPEESDGYRMLVDRLWPRGVSKERAALDEWPKDITPSTKIRKEFKHSAENFPAFTHEYHAELDSNPYTAEFIAHVKELLAKGNVTFIYGAKDPIYNHAIVLKDYVMQRISPEI